MYNLQASRPLLSPVMRELCSHLCFPSTVTFSEEKAATVGSKIAFFVFHKDLRPNPLNPVVSHDPSVFTESPARIQ